MGIKKKKPTRKNRMSDDCFFNPAACETAAEGGDEAMMDENAEEWAETEAWVEEHSQDLFEANLAYLLTSGGIALTAALELFMYKFAVTIDGTDEDGEDEDWIYYFSSDYQMRNAEYEESMPNKTAATILAWGSLAIFGAAHITQLLSMLGMAVSINGMVWWWGVGMGSMIVSAISAYIWLSAMQTGWAQCNAAYDDTEDVDSDDATECSSWASFNAVMENNLMYATAGETATALTLWSYYENWMVAQWWAMPEEERYEMWLEHKDAEDDKMFAKMH